MTHKIGNIVFGKIKNVRKSGNEDDVYFADVGLQEAEGFPMELCLYCARADDYSMTGRWVYQQIINGNIEGAVTQLAADIDPVTGQLIDNRQPTVSGAQEL